MTLVEFIEPLLKKTHQDRILAVLYFCERYAQETSLTVDEIRQKLKQARATGWAKVNVADVLSKSGSLADTNGLKGKKRLWNLTDSGREHVRELLGLPAADIEIEHDAGTLEKVVSKVHDDDIRAYLEEALKCLKVDALRACVVFVWVAAIRSIQSRIMTHTNSAINSAVQKFDSKVRSIKTINDFSYVKESIVLLVANELGILDKSQKDILSDALNLRNKCGHPGKYRPGIKKVSAFIEDIMEIVFP